MCRIFASHVPKGTAGCTPRTWHLGCVRPSTIWRNLHAREGDVEASPAGEATRQGAEHAGGRVRPRGDPSRSGGKTRRAFDEAGHRDRTVEGTARGCKAAAAGPRLERRDQAQCEVREPCRTQPQTSVASAIPRGPTGAEAGGPERRVAKSARTSGKNDRTSSIRGCPQLIGAARGADKGTARETRRCSARRAHTAEAETSQRLNGFHGPGSLVQVPWFQVQPDSNTSNRR